MKRILFLAAFMLLSMAASAQDIIVKKNGEEIRAKVEEVGERSIRYRKFTNLTGPVYSISRSEVFVIRYESGAKDIITPLDRPAAAGKRPDPGAAVPSQAAVSHAAAQTKKKERAKLWEWGVRADIGLSFWSMKDDINGMIGSLSSARSDAFSTSQSPRIGAGLSVFGERYFRKTGEGHIGFGLGYMQTGGATQLKAENLSVTFKNKFDAVFAHVYYGLTPVKKGFSMRIGFRVSVPTAMKVRFEASPEVAERWQQDEDLQAYPLDTWHKVPGDMVKSAVVAAVLEYGYKFGHSEIGLQWLQNFVSPHEAIGSNPWSLGLTYAYRF